MKYSTIDDENLITLEEVPVTNTTVQNSEIISKMIEIYNATYYRKKKNSWATFILKGGLYLIAINAGVPYVKPASEFSTNSILSPMFGASVYIALGAVSVWSVRNFMNYIELIRNSAKKNNYSEVVITASSILLGVASALPGAIITWKYNPFWVLPLSLFLDISTNTASFNEFFRKIYNDRFCYRGKPELLAWRDDLIEHLQYGINSNDFMLDPNSDTILNELKDAIMLAESKLKVRNQHPRIFNTGLSITKNLFGIILPLSWEIVAIYLVYTDMRSEFNMNKFFSSLIAIMTTLPTYFLEYMFGKWLVSALYNNIANGIYGITTPNPAFINNPKITIASLLMAMSLVSFAFTSRAKITSDLFDESAFRTCMLISVCSGTIVFKMSAILSNVIGIENALFARFTSVPSYMRQILYDKFQIILETANPLSIETLMPIICERKNEVDQNRQVEQSEKIEKVALNNPKSESVPLVSNSGYFGAFFNHKRGNSSDPLEVDNAKTWGCTIL